MNLTSNFLIVEISKDGSQIVNALNSRLAMKKVITSKVERVLNKHIKPDYLVIEMKDNVVVNDKRKWVYYKVIHM